MTMNVVTNNLASRNNYSQSPQSPSFKAVSGNFLEEAARTAAIEEDLRLYYKLNNKVKPDEEIVQKAKAKSKQIYESFKPLIDKVKELPKEVFNLTMDMDLWDEKTYHRLIVDFKKANGYKGKTWGNLLCSGNKDSNLKKFLQDEINKANTN